LVARQELFVFCSVACFFGSLSRFFISLFLSVAASEQDKWEHEENALSRSLARSLVLSLSF